MNESTEITPKTTPCQAGVLTPILDCCCGSRMMWFNKNNPLATFMDIRNEDCYLTDGQLVMVHPNIIGDFTAMPFPDESFYMVVFDPPHLRWEGKDANLYKRFGCLDKDWRDTLAKGFKECFRVLKPYGTLVFKWSDVHLKLRSVLALTEEKPLFGHRRGNTFFVCFMKIPAQMKGIEPLF